MRFTAKRPQSICLLTLAALGLLASLACAQDGAALEGPKTYYGMVNEGNVIGWAEVTGPVERDVDGRAVLETATKAVVETKALGQTVSMHVESLLVVDAETLALVSYDWDFERGDLKRRIECRTAEGKLTIRSWQGDAERDPVTIDNTDDIVMYADLDVGALALIARRFPLEPGETAEARVSQGPEDELVTLAGLEPTTRTVQGVERELRALQFGPAVVLLSDPESGQLVLVEGPGGKPAIFLADESVVEAAKAGASVDVLATHFIRSNVPIADFRTVTRLVADVEIDAPIGPEQGRIVCTGPIQSFEGAIDDDHVSGRVTIETKPVDATGALAFPVTEEFDPSFEECLEPSTYIESDDEAIIAKAKELTDGATTIWEAVHRVADWVFENVRGVPIADSPSAKLALETLKGDCGPHATLTCALLRAVGIPARLVGGLTYAPHYGGSFGQHAWVEAYLGEPGWVTFDSTTGEIDQLSAVHVKVFDGLGQVLPKSFVIVEHEGGGESAAGELRACDLPYDLDTEYTWHYVVEEKEVGAETITFTKGEDGAAYKAVAVARFGEGDDAATFTRTVTLAPSLEPLTWEVQVEAGGETTTTVLLPRPAGEELTPGTHLIENNTMLPLVLTLPRMVLEPGKLTTYQFYTVEAGMEIALPFQLAEETVPYQVGDTTVDCTAIDLPMAEARFLLDERGRLVAETAHGVTIEMR